MTVWDRWDAFYLVVVRRPIPNPEPLPVSSVGVTMWTTASYVTVCMATARSIWSKMMCNKLEIGAPPHSHSLQSYTCASTLCPILITFANRLFAYSSLYKARIASPPISSAQCRLPACVSRFGALHHPFFPFFFTRLLDISLQNKKSSPVALACYQLTGLHTQGCSHFGSDVAVSSLFVLFVVLEQAWLKLLFDFIHATTTAPPCFLHATFR